MRTRSSARSPTGYDTEVGERGLTLSGGQRQRIAIARAVLTDPRVLVLDDATSSIDSRTEEQIHATLREITADRTTIVIAHRRSTLRLADRIVVVEDGRAVEEGTLDELTAHVGAVPHPPRRLRTTTLEGDGATSSRCGTGRATAVGTA